MRIAELVQLASSGDHQAMISLISMSLGSNNFLSRKAAKVLRDHFQIKTEKTDAPETTAGDVC